MESTEHAPGNSRVDTKRIDAKRIDEVGAFGSGDGEGDDGDEASVGGTIVHSRPPAQYVEEPPAPATSVGLWGPSGMGKTQFAATLLHDGGYAPALYIDLDGGLPALAGYHAADLLVPKSAKRIDEVISLVRDVESGRIKNRAGHKVRSVIIDAVSCLQTSEIGGRGLTSKDPKDQAQALIQPFKVFWGQLRALHRDHGVTCVHVCHSKDKSVKLAGAGSDTVDFYVPAMFNSIATPWMESVRHLWRITKMRGKKGPAYPIVMLRTEQEGVPGTPTFCKYMKTSSIAFAQWLADISRDANGKQLEHYQWDTGTVPLDDQPTLAYLLRAADGLADEQGKAASKDPRVLRALASLQAAMDAA